MIEETVLSNIDVKMAQYLESQGLAKWSSLVLYSATCNGDFRMTQWLCKTFADRREIKLFRWPDQAETALEVAAKNGHLRVLEYLHGVAVQMKTATSAGSKRKRGSNRPASQRMLTCSETAMFSAISHGHVDVVEWLQLNYNFKPTLDSIDKAAEHGHLEMVKWLEEHTDCTCTSLTMDAAAKGGYLSIVQWLHFHRSVGCSQRAMDNAAKMGHLRVVRWLHRNRVGGCTTRAMNCAAKYGHFDVVLFLHSQRTEGVSAMRVPFTNRPLAAWLQENYLAPG